MHSRHAWLLAALSVCARAFAEDAPPAESDPARDAKIAESVEKLRSRFLREREAAEVELAAYGNAAVPFLTPLLELNDIRVQRAAIATLGRIGTAESVEPLVSMLTHPDASVRTMVENAVRSAGPQLRPALLKAKLAQTTTEEGAAAIDALLAGLLAAEVEEVFLRQITSSDSTGFYEGQFSDFKGREDEYGPILLLMFSDPNFDFRRAGGRPDRFRSMAADALGEIGYKPALEELRSNAESMTNPGRSATFALWKMGDTSAVQKMETELLESVENAPRGVDTLTRYRLAELYSRTGQHEKTLEQYNLAERSGDRNYVSSYNKACALSRLGRKAEAVAELKVAVERGYTSLEWMSMDRDLDAIRGESGYKSIVKQLGGDGSEAPPPIPSGPGGGKSD